MDRCGPPFFRAFDALAVDDAEARAPPVGKLARLRIKRIVHAREHAIAIPADHVIMHDALGGEILRQLAPLASSRQHVENCVQQEARIGNPMTPRRLRRRHQRRDQRPLLVRQIARITAVLALVGRSVIVRPHSAPPANHAHGQTESQLILGNQQISGRALRSKLHTIG